MMLSRVAFLIGLCSFSKKYRARLSGGWKRSWSACNAIHNTTRSKHGQVLEVSMINCSLVLLYSMGIFTICTSCSLSSSSAS